MAMPRLAGGTAVTSAPSISTRPEVESSSPAMTRSSVDLPQPDGPTNTTNSPSFTCEVDALQHIDLAEGFFHIVDGQRAHAAPPVGWKIHHSRTALPDFTLSSAARQTASERTASAMCRDRSMSSRIAFSR